MISLVAAALELTTAVLKYSLVFTSFIGQLIVTVTTLFASSVFCVLRNVGFFLEVVYEDNKFLFVEELPKFTNNVITGVADQWMSLQDIFLNIFGSIYTRFSNFVSTLTWIVNAVSTVLTEVIILLKNFVILLGDSLWLILTFIPIQLPIIFKALFLLIRDIIVNCAIDVYMVLLRVSNFMTDVPLQSLVGILCAIVIVRLCVHFRDNIESQANVIYWIIVRKFLYLYHSVYHYFTDPEVRVIAGMARGQDLNVMEPPEDLHEDDGDGADALCVVCQERQKCVLILPCRHVCLCRDCCFRLYNYQRTCPICRTFIYHSVNIYL